MSPNIKVRNPTYSVFSFSDLEDFELLLASAKRHLSVDLVVDAFGVGQRSAVLPIRSELKNNNILIVSYVQLINK